MYDDVPVFISDFLKHMLNIKNRSKNSVNEYYYDLRYAFRFLKLYKSGINTKKITNELINETSITDLDIDFVKRIELSDLYEFLTYLSERMPR